MKELTRKLVECWGPCGYEHQVRRLIRDEVADLADEIWVDGMGNLICRVGSEGPRVTIAAHMDEIGLMALYKEEVSGYLRFTNLGGLFQSTLIGNRVQFEDGTIGVIGAQSRNGKSIRQSPPTNLDDFYVDVSGAENDFTPGLPAVFWREMATRGDYIIAKALDDRIGCLVAIEAMRNLARQTPNQCFFAFTVQEEVGLRGARTAGFATNPDIAIALDVTDTGDTPGSVKMPMKLGAGTAIKLYDPGLIVPRAISNWMLQTATENDIAHQREVLPGGTTDSAAIQVSHSGVPSGVISIPTRHLHTTSETVHSGDVQASIDLLTALLAAPATPSD